jgi:hypothetical protein
MNCPWVSIWERSTAGSDKDAVRGSGIDEEFVVGPPEGIDDLEEDEVAGTGVAAPLRNAWRNHDRTARPHGDLLGTEIDLALPFEDIVDLGRPSEPVRERTSARSDNRVRDAAPER